MAGDARFLAFFSLNPTSSLFVSSSSSLHLKQQKPSSFPARDRPLSSVVAVAIQVGLVSLFSKFWLFHFFVGGGTATQLPSPSERQTFQEETHDSSSKKNSSKPLFFRPLHFSFSPSSSLPSRP